MVADVGLRRLQILDGAPAPKAPSEKRVALSGLGERTNGARINPVAVVRAAVGQSVGCTSCTPPRVGRNTGSVAASAAKATGGADPYRAASSARAAVVGS